jgi:hypothetical protein
MLGALLPHPRWTWASPRAALSSSISASSIRSRGYSDPATIYQTGPTSLEELLLPAEDRLFIDLVTPSGLGDGHLPGATLSTIRCLSSTGITGGRAMNYSLIRSPTLRPCHIS